MTSALLLAASLSADIVIDARHVTPISPYIYGVNYPDSWISDWLGEWKGHHEAFTMAREGGNRFSAYNWETNASNAGNDYFNENDDYLGKSDEPGWTVRQFLRAVQETGAASLITVPTLGRVSADKDTNMNGDKDVGKTPDYLNVRFIPSYPSKVGRKPSFPPDVTDRAVYQDEFVSWVQSVRSPRAPVWFSLDNEPDLWHETHRRIETEKTTYARITENNAVYASMIKSIAPKALVFGPANYGWGGFRNFRDAPDANGRDFVDTYLAAMRDAGRKAGRRLVDVYDFHWYPEATGDGIRIIYDNRPDKPGTAVARIQAPRSLWDPSYVETSWIPGSHWGKPIMLLPDMAARIAKNYPGTKMAITEYDFGGRNTISGALAQADALGVFGRNGVFAACHWGLNHQEAPAFAGFRAFTDFDRKGARFGDRGLAVSGERPAEESVYAALDSHDRKRMTVVAINKTATPRTEKIELRGFRGRSVRSFTVAEGSYDTPKAGEARLADGGVEIVAPPLSVTTAEVWRT